MNSTEIGHDSGGLRIYDAATLDKEDRMKRIDKRFVVLVLLISAAGALFAAPSTERSSATAPVTLRLSWWTNEERTAVTLETIAAFEAQNPGVRIEPEYTSWAGFWDKLATQIASNDTPDVLQMTQVDLSKYAHGGVIAALDGYPLAFDKVDSAALDSWKLNGKTWGLPAGLNGWAVLYNPEIFDRAGVPHPTPEWTWADFEAIATRIRERTGLYGVSYVQMNQELRFLPRQAGYNLYAPDGKSFGFTDYSFITDYLAMMSRLHQSKALIEHTFTVENFNNWTANPITFAEAAMVFIPSNQAAPINAGVGKALPMVTVPGTAARKSTIISAAVGFSMSASTANDAIAARLVGFFGIDPEAQAIGRANRGVPATAEARAYMLERGLDPGLAAQFKFIDIASPTASPMGWAPNPRENEIAALCDEIFSKVMFGVSSPAEAAAEFYRRGNEILGR